VHSSGPLAQVVAVDLTSLVPFDKNQEMAMTADFKTRPIWQLASRPVTIKRSKFPKPAAEVIHCPFVSLRNLTIILTVTYILRLSLNGFYRIASNRYHNNTC
jgi:hypothetical protein